MSRPLEHFSQEAAATTAESMLVEVDRTRRDASARLDPAHRARMGQFLTPGLIANFMTKMFDCEKSTVRILDPGAGAGTLCAALVLTLCQRAAHPTTITVSAYEIDPLLLGYLRETMDWCRSACEEVGISFRARLLD